MHQGVIIIGLLAGGLGLFLLAVGMITDGLRQATGYALRDMLGKWTRSPVRGIVTGLSITAIVQSSSAVTVATIGTTMTDWLVAIVGFRINVETFALPMS